jgi:hypothetical protein
MAGAHLETDYKELEETLAKTFGPVLQEAITKRLSWRKLAPDRVIYADLNGCQPSEGGYCSTPSGEKVLFKIHEAYCTGPVRLDQMELQQDPDAVKMALLDFVPDLATSIVNQVWRQHHFSQQEKFSADDEAGRKLWEVLQNPQEPIAIVGDLEIFVRKEAFLLEFRAYVSAGYRVPLIA